MKLMEKSKRFFTLNAAKHEGFTLVELIVVIAILAILAGIAVPAYSGYIKKAEKAGDLQLLGAINEAFAAACMVDNKAATQISSATLDWDGKKVVGIATVSGADLATVQEAFDMFYGDNKSAEFKYFEEGKLVFVNGVFEESESLLAGVINDILNNPEYAETIQAIKDSSLGKAGATNLAGQYDTVGGYAGLAIGLGVEKLLKGEDFSSNTFASVVLNEEYLAQFGIDEEKLGEMLTNDPAGTTQFLANSLVLNAAQGAADKDAEYVTNLISSASINDIKTAMKNPETAQAALTDTALIYGVYTAYLYDTDPTGAADKLSTLKNSKDLTAALEVMQNDTAFETYMKEGNGQDDINAYLDALDLINEATSDAEVKNEVLQNGFADDQMMSLLTGILGNK